MIRRSALSVLAVFLALNGFAKPAIKVSVALISPTLEGTPRQEGPIPKQSRIENRDYMKTVNDELIREFIADAQPAFPFVEWSAEPANPVANLTVQIVEEPNPPSKSNYRIKYWIGGKKIGPGWVGGWELKIKAPEPFIKWNAAIYPTTNPTKLIELANQQIKKDVEGSTTTMVAFFLKDVAVIELPPPKPPVKLFRVYQMCRVELPLTWELLQAGKESKLDAVFHANDSRGRSKEGNMFLEDIHPCGDDCPDQPEVMRARITGFNHDALETCPGKWDQKTEAEVSRVLETALTSMKICVRSFTLGQEKPK